jgi:hypothetical protein
VPVFISLAEKEKDRKLEAFRRASRANFNDRRDSGKLGAGLD